MKKYSTDVLIIGAGAIGTALARELSKLTVEVLVVDKLNDVGGDASKSNSAIIHTGFDAPPDSLESMLVANANPMYDKLCSDLEIPFKRTGALLVAVTEEEEQALPMIIEKAHANHVYDIEMLTADEIFSLEPAVTKAARGGLLVPRESIIDPFLYVTALAENAAANGVEFILGCEISNITEQQQGFLAEADDIEINAKFIVNAAGLYTDKISSLLNINDFKVHPRRGQFHIMDKAAPIGTKKIILPVPTKLSKGKICTPTIHGNWLIGPTAEELDDKSASQSTREGLQDIIAGVRKLVPNLDASYAITQYAGLRPVRTPGGYHIRTFENCPGYLELSGIRSTGLSSSLAVAVYACDKLHKIGLTAERKPHFIAKRQAIPCFRDADEQQQEKLIAENPLYGRVICRCETVTEAEIREAIRRTPGARDIDGIKRRLRAGLGRCQGGFCGMRIPQILAEELNIPTENVTKKGRGSEILIGSTKSLRKQL